MSRPFTVDDLYLHQKITALHCAPDSGLAVCSVKSIDREADACRSHLWTFALGECGGRALTEGTCSDTSPRWSPQGDRVAFLSDRSEDVPQVHLVQPDGSGLRQLGKSRRA